MFLLVVYFIERDLHAIRSVSLAEMRSVRRHTPPIGLQYIIIVLTSGICFLVLMLDCIVCKWWYKYLDGHFGVMQGFDIQVSFILTHISFCVVSCTSLAVNINIFLQVR